MTDKYQFFSEHELACKCGCGRGQDDMEPRFMHRLIFVRMQVAIPMKISSGFRCPSYNNEISRTGYTGPHTTGQAVDILVYGEHAHKILKAIFDFGFLGVGLKQVGNYNNRFIHLDTCPDTPTRPRPWIWTY